VARRCDVAIGCGLARSSPIIPGLQIDDEAGRSTLALRKLAVFSGKLPSMEAEIDDKMPYNSR
jgi:hypothetical protein